MARGFILMSFSSKTRILTDAKRPSSANGRPASATTTTPPVYDLSHTYKGNRRLRKVEERRNITEVLRGEDENT